MTKRIEGKRGKGKYNQAKTNEQKAAHKTGIKNGKDIYVYIIFCDIYRKQNL